MKQIFADEIQDVVVLKPTGRLDVTSGPVLEGVVEKLFEQPNRKVLIDFAQVEYVSSLGISACLKSAQLAQARGGRVVLAALQDGVRKVFDIAQMGQVLPIYSTVDKALESFDIVVARFARGSADFDTGLTLAEEILLLVLNDEDGRFIDLPEYSLDFALAGAIVMELQKRWKLDSDLKRVRVVDSAPLGDSLLDPVLSMIARSPERAAEAWIGALAREGDDIRRRVVDRLVERGVLERKDNFLYWMMGGRRYPMINGREQREVRVRVLGVLQKNEIPGPKEAAIIALADACAVFDAVLDMDAMFEVAPRIQEIAQMDLLAQAMKRALLDVQSRGGWHEGSLGFFSQASDAAR